MKMYDDLATWWPLVSSPDDYAEEADFYRRVLLDAAGGPGILTILELGSGGGNNASHLKRHFQMTLVDAAAGMLDVSRALNPECVHVQGDMRDVRLGRTFDAVFVHDAIDYMTTPADLRLAMDTAFVHTAPGGVALFCPDHVAENFRPSAEVGGHDEPDGARGVRFVQWSWDPDSSDETAISDFAFLLRHDDGSVTVEHDRHTFGLFPRALWLRTLAEAGFTGARAVPFEHSEVEPGTAELFVARRSA